MGIDDYESMHDLLKDRSIDAVLKEECGFNLRERLNVYCGAVLGALVPPLMFTYLNAAQDIPMSDSIAMSIPSLLVAIPGFTLMGLMEAHQLRSERSAAGSIYSKV
jgi:hypothetical protein